jgi:predicted DNA-binding protein
MILNYKGIHMLKNKSFLPKITPQYIIDKAGKKTGVILDILAFEQLLEEIEDIYFASIAHKALQEEDEYITHSDVKKKIARKR